MADPQDPGLTSGRHPVSEIPMRWAIARRMTESKQQAPHFYLSTEIEMDALVTMADAVNQGRPREDPVTVTAHVLRAVALSLAAHPAFNAVWAGDTVERWDAINIGVAIALDDGLIAPALLDCRDRGIADVAAGLGDLVARTGPASSGRPRSGRGRSRFPTSGCPMSARSRRSSPHRRSRSWRRPGPSSAPWCANGQVVVRRVMSATLSSDHRVVDGVGAAGLLRTLKGLIEAPGEWAEVEA